MPKPKFNLDEMRRWQNQYRFAKRVNNINIKMMLHIQKNDMMAVEACIRKGADVNWWCKNSDEGAFGRRSHVHTAVLYGRLEILRFLVIVQKAEADSADRNGLTPLDYITTRWREELEEFIHWSKKRTRQMIECLVRDGGADINRLGDRTGAGNWTPFHEAVANNRLDVAQTLFTEGADVHLPGPEDEFCEYCTDENCVTTPLYSAGRHANSTMTDFLVNQCQVNVNFVDDHGTTPLFAFCKNPVGLDSLKCLVHDGNADTSSIRDRFRGETALHRACSYYKSGSWPVLNFLIFGCKMDVNALNSKKGWTPLFCLMHGDRYENEDYRTNDNFRLEFAMKMVEEGGANPRLLDNIGSSLLHTFCRPSSLCTSLSRQPRFVDDETVRYLVESCSLDFHAKNQKGESPFFMACGTPGAIEILRYSLAQNPGLLSVKDDDGDTLLHLACYARNQIAVDYLLFELEMTGAAIDTKNADGWTALDIVTDRYDKQRGRMRSIMGSIMGSISVRKFRIRQEEQNWMRYLLTNGLGSGSNRQGLGAECAERMTEFL